MSEPITSLQNQRIKDVAKLRDRRQRQQQRRMVIDGARELHRAIVAGLPLLEVFVCPELCHSREAQAVLAQLTTLDATVTEVTAAVFQKLAFGDRAEGVLGVAHPPVRQLSDFQPPVDALLAVVEGAEKPGNIGAIVRSAAAAGVAGLIVVDGETDLFNPNAIRASLGAIFHLPVFETTATAALAWLRQHGIQPFAARVDADLPYYQADFRGPTALILGSEAYGLSARWQAADIRGIHLPMHGQVDSLNLSATAAVLFYEALRQRSSA